MKCSRTARRSALAAGVGASARWRSTSWGAGSRVGLGHGSEGLAYLRRAVEHEVVFRCSTPRCSGQARGAGEPGTQLKPNSPMSPPASPQTPPARPPTVVTGCAAAVAAAAEEEEECWPARGCLCCWACA